MSSFIKGNARFSVLTEGCIRIEYALDRCFADDPTLFAVRSSFCQAEITEDKDTLTVKTKKLTLRYTGSEPFSRDNLSVAVHTSGKDTIWHYGDESRNNLGSTLSTLDGVNGERPLPDGILSRDGFYVIDDSGKPLLHDGWLKARPGEHKTDLYFFAYGTDYKSALRDLSYVSGKMEMPRKYFMGSWYSRWWPYTSDEFLAIADEYALHDFPLDIMVMDMDWHYQDWSHREGHPRALFGYGHAGENIGWTGYTWNRTLIPDPEKLIDSLHKKGLKVVLNDHPADGIRDHDEMYSDFIADLKSKGYKEEVPTVEEKVSAAERENLSRNIENYRFNAGNRDYMETFFKNAHRRIEKQGVDFWWLDWQQDRIYPHVHNMPGLLHLPWLNHLYYENSKSGNKRGMSFSRWGGIGDHKHPAYFSGDAATGWETLAFEIKMTATAGNIGCFWWSHDIGGFFDPVPGGQAECYVRWVQFGATSAALRLHVCGDENIDRRPWTWEEKYCTAMREMFHLRSRLIPYLYSLAFESYRDSVPLLRPLYIEHPENEEAYLHPQTYMLGGNMVASPVCRPMEGKETVISNVWLPDGIWFDLFSSKRYEGGHIKVENTLNTFPLFVRAGFPLTTQPYRDRMTSAPYTEINIEVFCDGNAVGEYFLYEDDGESEGFKFGKRRITNITFAENDKKYTFTLTPSGDYENSPKKRDIRFVLKNCDEISKASLPQAEIRYDREKRETEILLKAVPANEKTELTAE